MIIYFAVYILSICSLYAIYIQSKYINCKNSCKILERMLQTFAKVLYLCIVQCMKAHTIRTQYTYLQSIIINQNSKKPQIMEQIKKYVAYYRVSTTKQGESGLGLAAQRTVVENFAKNGEIVAEFTEVESGKKTKKSKRFELLTAIETCKQSGATLLIAKLDRLSRNVSFTTSLMDSGLDFIVCDMPHANKLTIHIIAAIAQYEGEIISARTKAALAERRKKGLKMGTPENFTQQGRKEGTNTRIETAKTADQNRQAKELIAVYIEQGLSDAQIATKLNGLGFKTIRGKAYKHGTIYALKAKIQATPQEAPAHTTKPAKPTKKKA